MILPKGVQASGYVAWSTQPLFHPASNDMITAIAFTSDKATKIAD